MISHRDPDCRGEWGSNLNWIVCHECKQVIRATPERRAAAMRENLIGILAQHRGAEGRKLLSREERR